MGEDYQCPECHIWMEREDDVEGIAIYSCGQCNSMLLRPIKVDGVLDMGIIRVSPFYEC